MLRLPEKLEDFEQRIWERLRRGVVDKKDPFQVLTFISFQDNRPNPRSVILRKVDQTKRILIFHTDVRAAKVAEIKSNQAVTVHAWHPGQRLQLRMYGRAKLHHMDTLWKTEWNHLSPTSRLNYSSTLSPGIPISDPLAGWESYGSMEAIDSNSEDWKKNFAAISFEIEEIEGLLLSRGKHLRAKFGWKDASRESQWLVP